MFSWASGHKLSLVMGWLVSSPNTYVVVLIFSALDCSCVSRQGLWRGKVRSSGWALIQCDCCPCKMRKFGHRCVHREDAMKIQGENGHLQAKGNAFSQKPNLANTLIWESSLQNYKKIHVYCLSNLGTCNCSPSKLMPHLFKSVLGGHTLFWTVASYYYFFLGLWGLSPLVETERRTMSFKNF